MVNFKPQEVRAYSAELVVVTEREKFIVPVAALGHRAVLDFPDQVCACHSRARLSTTSHPVKRYGERRRIYASAKRGPVCARLQIGS